MKYISQTPTANSLENIPMLLKAKISPEDQENTAVPEVSIELTLKKIHLPKTLVMLENDETESAQNKEEEENQSIKDRTLMSGQKIEDNKHANEEREEQTQSDFDNSTLLTQGVQDENQSQGLSAKSEKAIE